MTALAAAAQLAHGVLSLLLLLAWARVSAELWTWKSALVLVTGLASLVIGAATAIRPSQATLAAGLATLGLSVLRVGDPYDWNWASWSILAATVALCLPILRALFAVREIDRIHAA